MNRDIRMHVPTAYRQAALLERVTIVRSLLLIAVAVWSACTSIDSPHETKLQESAKEEVVSALDSFVAELSTDKPADADEYYDRLRTYLDANPGFYGSAAALLNRDRIVTNSPYVYRTDGDFANLDLAEPSYNIQTQDWLTAPLAVDAGVWTDPYFDEGGGGIWMITYSVPVRDSEGIFAVVTTDLAVDAPAR